MARLKVAGYVHPPLQLQFARSVVPEQVASIQAFCRQYGFSHVITVVESAFGGEWHSTRLHELINAACRPQFPCDLIVIPAWSHVAHLGARLERIETFLLGASIDLVAVSNRCQPRHDPPEGGKWE